jgi:hypothetical protein
LWNTDFGLSHSAIRNPKSEIEEVIDPALAIVEFNSIASGIRVGGREAGSPEPDWTSVV